MNQYLTFWEGSADELGESGEYTDLEELGYDETMAAESLKAIVVGDARNEEGKRVKPYLYEEPKTRADKLSVLADGAEVEVVEFCEEEGWVLIKYYAYSGYMRDICLKYQFEGA